jgi:hypothetical protein
MSVLTRKPSWLSCICIALCLVLGCDQHGSIIIPDPIITPLQGNTSQAEDLDTPLHKAILEQQKDLALIQSLLETIGVNTPGREGNTALHLAVLQNNLGLVKMLVEAKASISMKNIAGITPLQLAIQKGNPKIIEQLGAVPSSVAIQERGTAGSLVYLLDCDYENIGRRILGNVSIKDKGHLRATCVEMNWMLLHKDAFHLRLTSDRLQYIRLQDYPRLYPHVQHANGITFQPIPADAVVQNVSDLKSIIEDSRFSIKNVVFKGERKHLEALRKALPSNLQDCLILPDTITEEESEHSGEEITKYSDEEPTKYADKENEEKPEVPESSNGPVVYSDEEQQYADEPIKYSDEEITKYADEEQIGSRTEEAVAQGEIKVVDKDNSLYNFFIGVNKLPSGKITIEKYLAEGAFGEVYKGSWGDRLVALKKIDVMKGALKLGVQTEDIKESI